MARKGGKMEYTEVMKRALYDPLLSFKAKGILLTVIGSKGELDTGEKLARVSCDGIYVVRNGIKELISRGYLKLETNRDENGQIVSRRYVVVGDKN